MKKLFIFVVCLFLSIHLLSKIIFTPQKIVIGQQVTFSIDNPNNCSSCRWEFGDGTRQDNVKDTDSVTHIYTKAGGYMVKITFDGCQGVTPPAPEFLTINVVDERTISVTPPNPKAHETITFTLNNALTNVVRWNFGDGSPEITGGSSITHVYNNSGNFKVSAKEKGFTQSPVEITVNISPDPRTVTFSPQNPREKEEITFRAKAFKASGLLWDFGDGKKVRGGPVIVHSYNNAGNYNIKVFDNEGKDEFPILINISVQKDLREITYNPPDPTQGEIIRFSAKGFKSSTLSWDFGDGTKKKGGSSITHFYRNFGIFEIRVSDNGGKNSNPFTRKIQITKDRRNITWEPPNPVDHEPVKFKLISFNTNGYLWRFGDRVEKRTSLPYITHTYNKPGTFTVRVYDIKGKFGTPLIAKVTISKDQRKVMVTKRTIHVGEEISIKAIGFKSNILLWDFGDGVKKTGKTEESHIYLKTGNYKITVNDKGGQDKKVFTVQVQVLPDQRKIEVSNSTIGIGEKAQIKALNFYSQKILWDFGDGVKKIGGNTETHYYRKKGEYLVKAIDYAGKDKKIFTAKIKVIIKPSKVSALAISGGELFFTSTGKNYSIAYLRQKNFTAKVRLKYEGTGIISAYWKIDDKHYKLVNQILSFGQSKLFSIKNIPTIETGLHKISFWIKSPKTKFELKGYYFVSPTKEKVTLIIPKDQKKIVKKEITLKWKPVEKAVTYRVILSQTIDTLFRKPYKEFKKKQTIFYIKNLSNGKYYWFVEAFDKNNRLLACSNISSFTIDTTP